MLQRPLLLINCKNYGDTGVLAERIARAAVKVLERRTSLGKKRLTIAVAVPATHIYRVAGLGLVPVLSQHLDDEEPGATTGHIIAEDLLRNGAAGSLLNHAEDQYDEKELARAVVRARMVGLTSVVCARDAVSAARFASFNPDFIAMEPPELIGGDLSVSTARPELVKETVAAVRRIAYIPVLVGAGVKGMVDVKKGMQLGAEGILVASGITKAVDFEAAISELADGFD